MADRVLRESCDHGRYERHAVNINVSCPGGAYADGNLKTEAEWREDIDYEAAWGYLRNESARPIDSDELVWIDKIDMMAAFDAALREA